MILLIFGIILAIAAFIILGIDDLYEDKPISVGFRLCISLLIFIGFTILSCITSVPTGNTGVVVTFGRVEDYTLDSGIHFVAPWQKVKKMDNKTQIYDVELSCFSSDIQEVTIKYAVNYSIDKEHAQTIYKTIGENYVNTVMEPKVQESVKGVVAKYTAEQLIGQRGSLSAQVEDVLRIRLADYHINVVSTSLSDIDFTESFTNAVEAKQVAEQNKLRAKTEQEQAIIEANAAADKQRIKAQADADAAILAAEADKKVQQINADAAEYAGQKEAAILSNIGEQLTKYPGLREYYYFQAWDGKLPVTSIGDGVGIILDGVVKETEEQ